MRVKTVCALVFTPAHVINVFAAIQTRLRRYSYQCVVVICEYPGLNANEIMEMDRCLRKMVACVDNVAKIVSTSDAFLCETFARCCSDYIETIKNIASMSIDEIYYAHDIVGIIYQSFCCAYPSAKRIMYGDSFGYICCRDDSPLHEAGRQYWIRRLGFIGEQPAQLRWEAIRGMHFFPDQICSPLPIEHGNNLSRAIPLKVVARNTMLSLLERFATHCGAKEIESAFIAELHGRQSVILLMSNWAEAAITSAEGEIDMYVDMLAPYAERGAVVIAKTHPGSSATAWKLDSLSNRLAGVMTVIPFPEAHKRFPIELFRGLIEQFPFAGFTSVVITAKYFFGSEKASTLTSAIIDKYMLGPQVDIWKNELAREAAMMVALSSWDGKSAISVV